MAVRPPKISLSKMKPDAKDDINNPDFGPSLEKLSEHTEYISHNKDIMRAAGNQFTVRNNGNGGYDILLMAIKKRYCYGI